MDIAVVRNIRHEIQLQTLEEGTSDQNPIELTLGTGTHITEAIKKKKTNCEKFAKMGREKITTIPAINAAEETEEATKDLQRYITESYKESTVPKEAPANKSPYGETPWTFKEIIRVNRRLTRIYRETKSEENKT